MAKLNLGLHLGYWGALCPGENHVVLAQEAENLGYDSVWMAESWGNDCFTPLAWIGAQTSKIRLGTAVAQLSARTPTACAMATLAGRIMPMDGLCNCPMGPSWGTAPCITPTLRSSLSQDRWAA